MLKKIMLLAAAVAALVAIAAPAAQAQFKVTTGGVAIAVPDIVSFEGDASFELTVPETMGADATVEATIELKNGTVKVGETIGKVTEYHVNSCVGTFQLAGLPCTTSSTVANWPVTLKAQNQLEIHVNLHQVYYADAGHAIPVATTNLVGPVLADLDNAANIKKATLTPGAGLTMNGSPLTFKGLLNKTGATALAID